MNTRFLKSGLIVLTVSILFAVTVIFMFSLKQNQRFGGEQVFEKTAANITDIGTIAIETPDTTINLELEDNLWRVREADNYYAGYSLINGLFNEINSSLFYRHQIDYDSKEDAKYNLDKNGLRIITKTPNGQILNSVLVGSKTSNGLYHFAKVEGQPGIFLITGNYAFPNKMASWLQQPLLSLEESEISSYAVEETTAERPDVLIPFKISGTNKDIDISRHLKPLGYVDAVNVLQSENFDIKDWPEHKKLTITTFEGLVIVMNIFTNQNKYWATITLSTTTLPTPQTNDYIKNNAFLYNGWYFELNPTSGRILFNSFIN